jgi:hypothetical protein
MAVEITALINTQARGPVGPAGSDASVTAANVQTALAAAPEAARDAMSGLSFLNVMDYGATGDGVTDDTADVETCFAAGLASGVKSFYFPPGTYVLTNLDCPVGSHIFGAAPAGATAWTDGLSPQPPTRFITSDATSDVLRFRLTQGAIVENVEIEHVSASVTSTGYGIRLEASTPGTWPGAPFQLINCTIRNFARGLYNDSGNRIHISGSHLVQCDYGYYSTGVTSTLSCINSELGGVPKDGGNGQAWYLSNAQGAVFAGCEFGNCYRVGNIEGSSVVEITGCNTESVSGPYAVGITTGRLVITAGSCASVAAPFVRNTGTQTGLVTFNGFTIRSGGTVIFDGRAVGYETSVDGDFPAIINTPIACRRTTADFATVREYWSADRNPLPFGATPEIQRPSLAAVYATTTAASGAAFVGPRGLSLRTWTSAGSTALVNLADQADAFGGYAYAPVMARSGDSDITSFDWSRRMVIRFAMQRIDQGSGSTSDNEAAVLFGVGYARTTTGPLSEKGIGIQIANTSVTAVVHNGSAGASVALGTIADKAKKIVVLDYDGAGTLKASLTGHYDVTRAGGPTGDSAGYSNSILFSAWNTAGGTSQPHYSFSDLEIAYY